ncbi:MAG: hypothetical protein DYG98_21760 [Haliscomenobacteraceae bacterium CHB4]|nr:hypothetical protein [Haliscomenobacteraceae bacterium CHB4]
MMKEADEIFTVHSEFILYLRSFKFDMAQGIEKSWESIFVNLFKKSAPVIAIGMPEDEITPVGANRIYIKPDNSWQDKITDLIPKAKLTIVIIDNSEGLLWEIEQIARIGDPEKTVFFLPPSQERGLFYEDFKYKTNGFFNNNLPQFPLISNRYFISFNNEWEIMPLKNKSFLYYLNRFYEYFLNEKDDTIKCIAESGSIVKKIHGKTNWLFILTRIPNVFIMALQAFAIIIFFVAMLLIFVFKI